MTCCVSSFRDENDRLYQYVQGMEAVIDDIKASVTARDEEMQIHCAGGARDTLSEELHRLLWFFERSHQKFLLTCLWRRSMHTTTSTTDTTSRMDVDGWFSSPAA